MNLDQENLKALPAVVIEDHCVACGNATDAFLGDVPLCLDCFLKAFPADLER